MLLLLTCFLCLLLFPQTAATGARDGLILWYRSVLPVLFPFLVLCQIMVRLGLADRLAHVVGKPLMRLFHCSACGGLAILVGFICGFPMGAKITSDLQQQRKISHREATCLYGFVNNLSPAFLMSYLAADQLQMPAWRIPVLVSVLAPALLYGIVCGRLQKQPFSQQSLPSGVSKHLSWEARFSAIDRSITDSITGILRLAAYIMLFSMLSRGIIHILPDGHPALLLPASCIEVTSGLHIIAASSLSFEMKYLFCSMAASFGGLSALMQTLAVTSMDTGQILHYIKSRVMLTLLSGFFALGILLLFRFFL